MKNKIIAGIVTYNPELDRLEKNISSIINQVDGLVVVDNCSSNLLAISELTAKYVGVDLIKNNENKGIAFALNQIGDYALLNCADVFLTLDQDSIVANDYIKILSPLLERDDVGLVGPYINRKNDFEPKDIVTEVYIFISLVTDEYERIKLKRQQAVNLIDTIIKKLTPYINENIPLKKYKDDEVKQALFHFLDMYGLPTYENKLTDVSVINYERINKLIVQIKGMYQEIF